MGRLLSFMASHVRAAATACDAAAQSSWVRETICRGQPSSFLEKVHVCGGPTRAIELTVHSSTTKAINYHYPILQPGRIDYTFKYGKGNLESPLYNELQSPAESLTMTGAASARWQILTFLLPFTFVINRLISLRKAYKARRQFDQPVTTLKILGMIPMSDMERGIVSKVSDQCMLTLTPCCVFPRSCITDTSPATDNTAVFRLGTRRSAKGRVQITQRHVAARQSL